MFDEFPLFVQPNLTVPLLTRGCPWNYHNPKGRLALQAMPKEKRRRAMLVPTADWNVYTGFRGFAANQRIAKDNPPTVQHALVIDYDSVQPIPTVLSFLAEVPYWQLPNFIEESLSNKIRLVWIFEKPLNFLNTEHCVSYQEALIKKMGLDNLLAGFDKASLKPTEMWTNGGVWHAVKTEPLAWEYIFGVACDVSKKASLFNRGDVQIEVIAEEVSKRYPSRWQGEFGLDKIGVRFWDEGADNETGCQVKPDGMLCFTGDVPFKRWEDIFGRDWVEEKKVLNLGNAAKDIFFDGKQYWEERQKRWEPSIRQDIILRLSGRGLSSVTPKGATQSDVERVLDHVQQLNRVEGAAPMINYPPGIINHEGHRILNTSDLNPTVPIEGSNKDSRDFPFIWKLLSGMFARPELRPLDHWLSWMQRSYKMVYEHKRLMGQAVFLCGPKNNGKTLLCTRIVRPLMGGRMANPIDFMTGDTNFNDDLFESALLAINDEDAPKDERARSRMLAKLKGLVVNPKHSYHAKFNKKVTVDWNGRIFITLNDDPGSVGMLMEISDNTRDKQMNFATQAYAGVWKDLVTGIVYDGIFPPQERLEALIESELPYFAWWLLNVYVMPPDLASGDRMGVKSYFDPHILQIAQHQTYASNLLELLKLWQDRDQYWADKKQVEWTGTPTELLSYLQTNPETMGVAKEWTQAKMAKNMTALERQQNSPIVFINAATRLFKIVRVSEMEAIEEKLTAVILP